VNMVTGFRVSKRRECVMSVHSVRSAVAHLCNEMTYRAGSSWRSAADTLCPEARRLIVSSRIPGNCRCRGSGGDSHYPKSGIRDLEARSAAPGVGASRCCNPLHHRQMVGRRSPLTRRLGHPRHPAAAWWRPPVDCSHLQACIHVCRLLKGMSAASTRNAYSCTELIGIVQCVVFGWWRT